jgi:AraC family mar-sox-rob regulon transcriptional activator
MREPFPPTRSSAHPSIRSSTRSSTRSSNEAAGGHLRRPSRQHDPYSAVRGPHRDTQGFNGDTTARAPREVAARHPAAVPQPAPAPLPEALRRRARRGDYPGPCPTSALADNKPPYLPLSQTTERVLRMLMEGDLSRLRAESVAETLGISCTTLRRRLRNDHTNYQFLLDRARQFRCEARLRERWLPGKCLADELGYLEVNSFYRAFQRWTGMSYSDYKLQLI